MITLVASSDKLNVTVWRPSVRLPVLCLSVSSAYTQHDSPGGSTRRGQRTFPFEYYENRHTCMLVWWLMFSVLHLHVIKQSFIGTRCSTICWETTGSSLFSRPCTGQCVKLYINSDQISILVWQKFSALLI